MNNSIQSRNRRARAYIRACHRRRALAVIRLSTVVVFAMCLVALVGAGLN